MKNYSNKIEFVDELEKLLRMAKPNLIKCEYLLGQQIPENIGQYSEDEYVVITCENGCKYYVNVTCNSLIAIANEVFAKMTHK